MVGQGIVQLVPSPLSIMQFSWPSMAKSVLESPRRVTLNLWLVLQCCVLLLSILSPVWENTSYQQDDRFFGEEALELCDLSLCSSVLVASVRHSRIRVNFPEGRRGSRRAANDVFFPQMEQIVSAVSPPPPSLSASSPHFFRLCLLWIWKCSNVQLLW